MCTESSRMQIKVTFAAGLYAAFAWGSGHSVIFLPLNSLIRYDAMCVSPAGLSFQEQWSDMCVRPWKMVLFVLSFEFVLFSGRHWFKYIFEKIPPAAGALVETCIIELERGGFETLCPKYWASPSSGKGRAIHGVQLLLPHSKLPFCCSFLESTSVRMETCHRSPQCLDRS